ncbi:MAG: hypothetical protein GWN30_13485 [Gammaproteobacteria bacterium]|nr:hypothetical protein [Gammaproteobacteria bacterium]
MKTEQNLLSLAYANTRAYGHRLVDINPDSILDADVAVLAQILSALFSQRLFEGLWASVIIIMYRR